jgi:hypothetical protein
LYNYLVKISKGCDFLYNYQGYPGIYNNSGMYGQMAMSNNQQPQSVPQVTGKDGAMAYQLPPNSSALLMDNTAAIVWLVKTDSAGFKTAEAFDVTPHKQAEMARASTIEALEKRIEDIERRIKGNESNTSSNEPGDK